ncbi:protein phosphatase [Actinoplanes sp. NPDC024001]|uniref:protein-tyrosine phosphatase family protein n=1 Tax=Actinoplanes sp. NPDC024001 TaxID=3154598 RepID=UPI0034006CA6
MTEMEWKEGSAGVLRLPSGRLVRGRGLRDPMPAGHPPQFGVYLLGSAPEEFGWTSRWVRWRDFWVPADPSYAKEVLTEAWRRAEGERVEIACGGGRGRTGTALACLAVLDGVPPAEAVAYVRRHYHPRAVETPWQRRFVGRFTGDPRPAAPPRQEP